MQANLRIQTGFVKSLFVCANRDDSFIRIGSGGAPEVRGIDGDIGSRTTGRAD